VKRLNLKPKPERTPPATLGAWLLLLVAVAYILIATTTISAQTSRLKSEVTRLQGEILMLESKVAPLRPKLALAQASRQALEVLRTQAASLQLALMLEQAAPQGVWLSSLSLSSWQARVSGSGMRWQDVDELTRRLRDMGAQVTLDSLVKESGTVSVYRFAMTVAGGGARK
jgi:predicted RNase H-like nuclease (RuvC/YqgF family)